MEINELGELEKESKARGIPIIGSEKGQWLLEQVNRFQPQTILELGTANGYSGIILGSTGGKLTTLEQDAKIAEEARKNFEKYKVDAEIIIGDAVENISKLEGKYDLIFIDFAKKKYLMVLEDCLRLTHKGSVIIADNITMEGCVDFKETVLNHPELKTEIIIIKDGLSFSVKLTRKHLV